MENDDKPVDEDQQHKEENSESTEEQEKNESQADLESSEPVEQKKSKSRNVWKPIAMLMTVLFLVSLGAFIFANPTGMVTGSMSDAQIADIVAGFIQSNLVPPSVGVNVTNITKDNGFYRVNIELAAEGMTQNIESFLSADGKFFFPSGYDITETTTTIKEPTTEQLCENIPKQDKPSMEAFVFSYCPYGLQYQKGLLPVMELLKDKVDFRIVQIGAMHGKHEETEAKRQLCIKKEEGQDKLIEYLKLFSYDQNISACLNDYYAGGRDLDAHAKCIAPFITAIMKRVGIDETKVNSCMKTDGDELYNADVEYATSMGVTGSPTAILNGKKLSGALAGRSPEAIKTAVCCGFAEMPEECNETLEKETPAAMFETDAGAPSSGKC